MKKLIKNGKCTACKTPDLIHAFYGSKLCPDCWAKIVSPVVCFNS